MIPLLDDPSTWAIFQEELTLPQQTCDEALDDHWCVVNIGSNRNGKTRNLIRTGTKVCVGGYEWAPEPAHVAVVSKAMQTAGTSLQDYLEHFILYGLPSEMILRRTTRQEVTTPIRFSNLSRFDIKTEGMGWARLQGAGYNLAGFDEFPQRKSWKEMRARIKAGVPFKMYVAMTPTNGLDWFFQEVVEPAKEGKRAGIAIVGSPVFYNGPQGCPVCKRDTAGWEEELANRNLRRDWQFHQELKALCPRCHTFGTDCRIGADDLAEWEEEYHGVELGIRMYGALLDPRGTRCFTPAEMKALLTGCHNGTNRGGMKFWGEPDKLSFHVGGVDAAEGLGREHSETVASFFNAVNGVQTGLFADDEAQYHDYRETVDWMATKKFGQPGGTSALLVIEKKNMGTALIEEYKDRPHLWLYHQRDENQRGHVSGHGFGWVSHHESRDILLRNFFSAVRKNLEYHDDGRVTLRKEPHPRGMLIRDRKTVEQMKHLYYDVNKNNKITKPDGRRDDRVFGAALANEGRMHRRYHRQKPVKELTPNESWQEAVISRHEPTAAGDVQWTEKDGVLVPRER